MSRIFPIVAIGSLCAFASCEPDGLPHPIDTAASARSKPARPSAPYAAKKELAPVRKVEPARAVDAALSPMSEASAALLAEPLAATDESALVLAPRADEDFDTRFVPEGPAAIPAFASVERSDLASESTTLAAVPAEHDDVHVDLETRFVSTTQVAEITSAAPSDDVVEHVEGEALAEAPVYGLSGDWGGVRSDLEEHGIQLGFDVTLEGTRVLSGGVRNNTSAHVLYDLTLDFDLERIAGIDDAVLGFEAYVIDGHNPTADAGDFQFFSSTSSARETAQIAVLFYEQWFADHTARIKLGKWDCNSEFGFPGTSGESIHASSVLSPAYLAMPTYPNPATGVLAGFAPDEHWTLNLAVMDGAGWTGVNTGSLGPASFFGDPSDLYWIGEVGTRWTASDDDLAGGITAGVWHHTGDFPTTSGGVDDGAFGWYATFDQELSHDHDCEGGNLACFLQYGAADEDVAPVDLHLGGGVVKNGIGAERPDDALGCYVSYAHFSDGAGFAEDGETAFELYYRFALREGFALQPDLQYIANPSGDDTIDDAVVFTLRCEIGF